MFLKVCGVAKVGLKATIRSSSRSRFALDNFPVEKNFFLSIQLLNLEASGKFGIRARQTVGKFLNFLIFNMNLHQEV